MEKFLANPELIGHWPGLGLFTRPHSIAGAMMTFWVSDIDTDMGFPIPPV